MTAFTKSAAVAVAALAAAATFAPAAASAQSYGYGNGYNSGYSQSYNDRCRTLGQGRTGAGALIGGGIGYLATLAKKSKKN